VLPGQETHARLQPMAKYGRFNRRVGAAPAPEIPRTVTAKMPGLNDLEQTSRLFETLIARLQKEGISSLQNLSVIFDPVGQDGTPMAIRERRQARRNHQNMAPDRCAVHEGR
jgi:hypothetical protein